MYKRRFLASLIVVSMVAGCSKGGPAAVKPDGSVVYAADRSKLFRFIRKTGQRPEISVWPEVQYGMGVRDVK